MTCHFLRVPINTAPAVLNAAQPSATATIIQTYAFLSSLSSTLLGPRCAAIVLYHSWRIFLYFVKFCFCFLFRPPIHDAPATYCPLFSVQSGLKAVEATSKSEQLVTVPAKAAISLAASESTPFKSWVSPDFWDRCASFFLLHPAGRYHIVLVDVGATKSRGGGGGICETCRRNMKCTYAVDADTKCR